jgi:hypothetical protein
VHWSLFRTPQCSRLQMLDLKASAAAEVTAGAVRFSCGWPMWSQGSRWAPALDVHSGPLCGRQSSIAPSPKPFTEADIRSPIRSPRRRRGTVLMSVRNTLRPLNSVLKSPTLNLRVVPSAREPCRPRTTGDATFTSSQRPPALHLSPFRGTSAIRHNWKCRPRRLPGYKCFFRWE